jgi:hypothetical protein
MNGCDKKCLHYIEDAFERLEELIGGYDLQICMKCTYITMGATLFLIALSGLCAADILPQPVPENQIFTTDSFLDVTGATRVSTSLVWDIGDAGLDALARPRLRVDGTIRSGSIAYVIYSDAIATNGGVFSETKTFSLDTHAKTTGLYNIETKKILTYASQNGSHLMGAESYVLDVAGNWAYGTNDIICVFSKPGSETIPAFCNKATASSKLNAVTTAQIETRGGLTAISRSPSVPAALDYEISVLPDAQSLSGYADAIVQTAFTVSVMEGRSDGRIRMQLGVPGVPGVPGSPDIIDCLAGTGKCDNLVAAFGENPTTTIGVTFVSLSGSGSPSSPADGNFVHMAHPTILACSVIWERLSLGWRQVTPSPSCPPEAVHAFDAGFLDMVLKSSLWPSPYPGGSVPISIPTSDLWIYSPAIPGIPSTPPIIPIPLSLEYYDELAATITHSETTTMSGGISIFNKAFSYQSGIACANC